MNVSLNQEDLNLLFRILAENLGETTEDLDKGKPRIQGAGETKECHEVSTPHDVHAAQGTIPAGVGETRPVDIINVLLNFEVKEVCSFSCFYK
ncbi:vacuolar protein sorting-associated protein 13C-like, partial [Nannospalax galili]|uniref:vacuolar protein sorting-associated protein 13C-like n=1 Tax=Nannospalax galili TaxID=1026970 RepID=UPI00111BFF2C